MPYFQGIIIIFESYYRLLIVKSLKHFVLDSCLLQTPAEEKDCLFVWMWFVAHDTQNKNEKHEKIVYATRKMNEDHVRFV